MNPNLPPSRVCPLCATQDDITTMPIPSSDDWIFTCHRDSYSWEVKGESNLADGDGIMSELGLFDDLPECLIEGEPYAEHGIVEHRYMAAHPDIYFGELLPRYGHTAQGRKRYTVSSFLGQALGHLSRREVVVHQWCKPTGYFSFNPKISSWALPPGPPNLEIQTWAEFASANSLDPTVWDLRDPR